MRTLLAFVVAPLMGILGYVAAVFTPVFLRLGVSDPMRGISLALMSLVPPYLLAVVLGIPIFLLVRYSWGIRWWSSLLAGLAVLVVQGALMILVAGGLRGMPHPRFLLAGVFGACVYGLTFWALAKGPRARSQ